MITIEKITDFPDFQAMEAEWDGLLNKSEHNLLFLSHSFLMAEWEHIGWELTQKRNLFPFILIAKENDRILGLFPFIKERRKVYGIPMTVIRVLGHTYLDRSDIVLIDKKRDVVEKILRYLKEEEPSWNLLLIQNILGNTSFLKYVTALYRSNKFQLGIKTGYLAPYVERNTSWASYFKSRSANFHKMLNNKTNRLKKNVGEVVAQVYTKPAEIKSALQIAFDIDLKSWKALEGTAISSTENSRKYWQSLTKYLTQKDSVKIWILRANKQAIAFEYGVVHNRKVYCLKRSFDKGYHEYSPGLILKCKSMEFYWQEDILEIDLLGTSDSFKKLWSVKIKKHFNLYMINSTLYSRIGYLIIFRLLNAAAKVVILRRAYTKINNMRMKVR
jgi:CelD/BcsL family acetyltransferase involved in cellulose biosynthesis